LECFFFLNLGNLIDGLNFGVSSGGVARSFA